MNDDIEWIRPSGLKIKTKNTPAMIEFAKLSGWKKSKPRAKKVDKSDDDSTADS